MYHVLDSGNVKVNASSNFSRARANLHERSLFEVWSENIQKVSPRELETERINRGLRRP